MGKLRKSRSAALTKSPAAPGSPATQKASASIPSQSSSAPIPLLSSAALAAPTETSSTVTVSNSVAFDAGLAFDPALSVSASPSKSIRSESSVYSFAPSSPPRSSPPTTAPGSSNGSPASALALLRGRLASDEARRAASASEDAPKKLRKRRPGAVASENDADGVNRGRSCSESASVLSYVSDEGDGTAPLPEADPEEDVAIPFPTIDMKEAKEKESSYVALAKSTTLATFNLGLSAASFAVSLPLVVARHLPIVGTYLRSPTPTSTPDPTPPTIDATADATVEAPLVEEHQAPDENGKVWKAVEMGLGVGLATVLVSGAAVGMAWNMLPSVRVGKGKGKGKERDSE